MRYRRVEEGIARAVRRAVHYAPEILNPLSAALIGASGFVNGHNRWMLLILGASCLLVGTILGRKRDHDNEREISEHQETLARLESDKQRERDKVAQLEADNQRERNAMRRVLERLALDLCHELSLWDESTRVTIYGHIDDGSTSGFLPLARCSCNPRFEKLGRSFYRDSEVGYLRVAWEDGHVQRIFRSTSGARENLWKPSTDRFGDTRPPPLTQEEAKALELTMEPRSVIGIRLDADQGAEKHGVILFESMTLNKLSNQQLNNLLDAPQVRSLRIVMNAVSALFRSITIAQATEEAEEFKALLRPVQFAEGNMDAGR